MRHKGMAIPRTDPRSSSDQIWSNLARRLVPRRDEVRPWLPGGSGIGLCESAPQGKWRESSPTLGNHAAADHSVRRSPLTVARMPRLVIRIRTRETRPSHDHVWSEREAPPKEASESDAPPIEKCPRPPDGAILAFAIDRTDSGQG